jgi:HK97 family phage major capsid protein
MRAMSELQDEAAPAAVPGALREAITAAGGSLRRSLAFERTAANPEARTVALAFASEQAYERTWGIEILDVSSKAIRMDRLKSGAPLLVDHDTRDIVGVVETVSIGADRVARAVVRFGKSARAEEVFQDVLDGIRRNVSVGYLIHKAIPVQTTDAAETYRVTDWEPLEVSIVSVPADHTVGVGRAHEAVAPPASEPSSKEVITMSDVQQSAAQPVAPVAPITVTPRNHAAEISRIAASIPGGADLAMSAIQRGLSVEEFQTEAIKSLASKPVPTADIGMSKQEVKRYSVLRALNALANPTDQSAQRAAAFERECSDAAASKSGKSSRGMFLPWDVQKRDLTAGTANAGGNAVATDLLAGSFIELFRHAMVIDQLGARFLTGLQGNIAIPKLAGAATAYWVAENTAPTESQQTFAQVAMSPKTVGAFTDVSRRLLIQSSIDVEQLVSSDLATVLGLAVQQAAINGPGTGNAPSGILTQVTSTVAGGTNGAVPTWANMVKLETDVAVQNADVGNMAYLTNAKVRGTLKGASKVSGQNGFIWDQGDTPINGYRAAVSNAVPSNLTKGTANGVCSAIIFGNWSELMVGVWGNSLDMLVDPYTGGAAGTVRIVVLQDVDVAIRHVESFATMVDALTP